MKFFQTIFKTLLLLAIIATFFFLPALFKKTDQLDEKKIKTLIPQAKISSSPQESEFEKTTLYENLDCQNFRDNSLIADIYDKINKDRKLSNLPELKWSELLCKSASLKARDLTENNYFEHISPDGTTPWDWIEQAGYKYIFSGENLALNYYTAQTAHEALMNSPKHRENILNENFTEIGIDCGRGKINGQNSFVIVQHFASPAPEVSPVKYICEIEKAEKNLEELEKTKEKINKYLKEAKDIKKRAEISEKSIQEINEYIKDMEKKKDETKEYIKEIEEYLNECEDL